jgi:hypothetical protein
MECRDLPDVVKATFGVASPQGVKLLTVTTLLQKQHNKYCPASTFTSVPRTAQPILHFTLRNYYSKSQIPDPDPRLSGGLGQH